MIELSNTSSVECFMPCRTQAEMEEALGYLLPPDQPRDFERVLLRALAYWSGNPVGETPVYFLDNTFRAQIYAGSDWFRVLCEHPVKLERELDALVEKLSGHAPPKSNLNCAEMVRAFKKSGFRTDRLAHSRLTAEKIVDGRVIYVQADPPGGFRRAWLTTLATSPKKDESVGYLAVKLVRTRDELNAFIQMARRIAELE